MKKENIRIRPDKKCSQVFIVFTGSMAGEALVGIDFFKACDLFNRNLIILKDPFAKYYMNGLSKTVSSFTDLVAMLKEEISNMPWVTDVYCYGNSAGGVPALLAAHALHAKEAWSLAPVWEWGYMNCRAMSTLKIPRRVNPFDTLKQSNGTTQYHIYFHKGHDVDATFAAKFEEVPNAHLNPLEGTEHNVFPTMVAENRLESLFPPRKEATVA